MRLTPGLIVLVGLLVGCHTSVSTTEVEPDGSLKRTVRYTVGKFEMGPEMPQEDPADSIIFDDQSGWTVTPGEDERSKWVEATRSLAAGVEGGGYRLRRKEAETVSCLVTVRALPDGTLEYVETFRPLKEPQRATGKGEPLDRLRGLIAEYDPTPADLERIDDEVTRNLTYTVFGPPEPKLGLLLSNPEGALRLIRVSVGNALLASLRSTFEGRISEEQALAIVRETFRELKPDQVFNPEERAREGREPTEETGQDNPFPTAVTVVVKAPGRLVETNGVYDPVTGEVFWSLHDASTEAGEVVLRAVFRP